MVTRRRFISTAWPTPRRVGAGRDRARALEILRDSRIGTFGAFGLFFVLALKIFAIARYGGWPPDSRHCCWRRGSRAGRWWRWLQRLDYLRSEGAGTTLLAHDDRPESLDR